MDERAVVRRVEWQEVLPWLLLLRVVEVAISGRALLMATVGVLLTSTGWWAAEVALSPTKGDRASGEMFRAASYEPPRSIWEAVGVADVYAVIHQKLWRGWIYILRPPGDIREFFYLAFGGLWSIAVWLIIGGAILRIAVVRLGREVWIGTRTALVYVLRKIVSYIGAPLLPLLALLIGLSLLWLLGLCMRTSVGVVFATIVWPLVLVGAVLWTVLFLGLMFGWPFMWAALAAEQDGDAWDAVSRAYACVLQTPLKYLFYALVAVVPGWLTWSVVYHLCHLTVDVAERGVMRGMGATDENLLEVVRSASYVPIVSTVCEAVLSVLNYVVRAVPTAFGYSYFFSAAAGIYLLLRLATTQTGIHEVFLAEENDSLSLPPLPPTPETGAGEVPLPPSVP